jgi:hypothetical protein
MPEVKEKEKLIMTALHSRKSARTDAMERSTSAAIAIFKRNCTVKYIQTAATIAIRNVALAFIA